MSSNEDQKGARRFVPSILTDKLQMVFKKAPKESVSVDQKLLSEYKGQQHISSENNKIAQFSDMIGGVKKQLKNIPNKLYPLFNQKQKGELFVKDEFAINIANKFINRTNINLSSKVIFKSLGLTLNNNLSYTKNQINGPLLGNYWIQGTQEEYSATKWLYGNFYVGLSLLKTKTAQNRKQKDSNMIGVSVSAPLMSGTLGIMKEKYTQDCTVSQRDYRTITENVSGSSFAQLGLNIRYKDRLAQIKFLPAFSSSTDKILVEKSIDGQPLKIRKHDFSTFEYVMSETKHIQLKKSYFGLISQSETKTYENVELVINEEALNEIGITLWD